MHVPGWSLGRAVRRLADGKRGLKDLTRPPTNSPASRPVADVNSPIRTRFVRIGTSVDFDMLSRRLREVVVLLRNARIPLDYGLLADQLNYWQDEASQGDVRRSWGRDFHRAYITSATDGDEEATPDAAVQAPDALADEAVE
ncbi:hypothetical protein D3C57_109480 [Streptomyces rapamycinicus NRRL 5491]|uniref:CRISPR-associated protein Cse2 n=2 Tax=Streptomyces rapamycinicus TaxID=1226757 RepID=A0A3L8RGQ7_STRRN|nr:hypothetical protein D3C57_109480 [Streptomyces rapamycinicus NRRL 5491]